MFLQGNYIDFFYLLDKFDLKKLSFGIMRQIIEEIRENGVQEDHIIYINFEY